MKRGYGQYCPLALAVELLCERWTLLVISRLIDGCCQFNAIHRGVPRIAPSMLSRRLSQLERAGIISRAPARRGAARRYTLTPAGRDLAPIVESLAIWGQHWARDMQADDLDPAFLVWSMHTRLDVASMPSGRVVLGFELSEPRRDCYRFWLVKEGSDVEMCLKDPGYEVDVHLRANLRLFIEAWRGIRDLRAEIRARRIQVIGASALTRQLPEWLRLSSLASYARQQPGREMRLAQSARVAPRKTHAHAP
jgi:DNA-binding HxlR family transcriptional regulator